jgi:hypothetical protein
LPSGLKNVSAAISMGNFEHVARAPAEEIARARDDAKNSLAIALSLYDANRWNLWRRRLRVAAGGLDRPQGARHSGRHHDPAHVPPAAGPWRHFTLRRDQ